MPRPSKSSTTKPENSPKPAKFYVDPRLVDKAIELHAAMVNDLLEISTRKCDPVELQYAMSRAAGFQNCIRFIINHMSEDTKNELTWRKTGPRTFPCPDCGSGESGQDRKPAVRKRPAKNPKPKNGDAKPAEPES